MEIFRLSTGIKVIYQKTNSPSVAIQVNVKVGSIYEKPSMFGISHFIEHMVFEGTANRESSLEIGNEIESLGGELNAYTSDERTAYHVKILKKYFDKGLDVLADMIQNPLFRESDVQKEKKIVMDEIKMVTDDPRRHQWVLFEKTLFRKHPVRNPTYGDVKVIKNLTRKQVLDYYSTYYAPNNIVICIVGDVPGVKGKVEKAFSGFKKVKVPVLRKVVEPEQKKALVKIEKRKLGNSYYILGYKTPSRLDKESYALDVIRAVLGRGQSGKMFYEIRTKRGLAYEVGVHHDPSADYGFFAVYLNTHKKNKDKAKSLILGEFDKLQQLTQKELDEAKKFIEGTHVLSNEDNFQLADLIGFWSLVGNEKLSDLYIKNIKNVKLSDVKKAAKKYLNKNYTLIGIEQK